jgi:glycosyltransferase involved in cell wall biosynthesis
VSAPKLRVLLVPDSIHWVLGTIAKSIATANPWLDVTIVSGPLLSQVFSDADSIAARFDLVHFLCPYASRDWLPMLRSRVPVVTSHHHVTSWDLIRHNIDGDAIVAGSAEWVDDLAARGADVSRVFRVPYGVDVNLFTPARDTDRKESRARLGLSGAGPVVGFFAKRASNDDDRKGTGVFVEAMMLLHKKIGDASALIVGPGWQDLVKRFRDNGIRCTWLPFVEDPRDLPRLYHALDFYWVTSRVEGGPVPLLEAMSSAVCCLSTRVGLAKEVVRDGVNAMLLPMNEPAVFASRTVELWGDTSRREAIARGGRETMEAEMRADVQAQLYRQVYDKATQVFAARNPQRGRQSATSTQRSLTSVEEKRVRMLEDLAWAENLVMYQDQHGAAIKLIGKAWGENPLSIQPLRVLLRRFLPEPLTRGVVSIKRKVAGAPA